MTVNSAVRTAVIWCWMLILTLAEALEISKERQEEVCSREEFTARCGYNEVILITNASFGHLYPGRCITKDRGLFGCKNDLTRFVDGRCSGKRSCAISLTEPEFDRREPECADGLKTFMDVTYVCIKGQPLKDFCSILSVQPMLSFFVSFEAEKATCTQRNSKTYIEMAAKEGQNILVKILHIHSRAGTGASNNTEDLQYGYVEDGMESELTYRSDERGTVAEYTSKSHQITLVLKRSESNRIITLQATGCLEIKPPLNTWSERKGDVLTIKCYNSEKSWNLKCMGTKWVGVVGNCTLLEDVKEITKQPPVIAGETEDTQHDTGLAKGIIVLIIAVVTFVMCTAVVVVGCICVRMARRSSNLPKDYNKCELFPVSGSLSRAGGHAEDGEENIGAWQQSLQSNNSMGRSLPRNNNQQMIIMDRDLITINGISHS